MNTFYTSPFMCGKRFLLVLFSGIFFVTVSCAQDKSSYFPDHNYELKKSELDPVLKKFEDDAKKMELNNKKAEQELKSSITEHIKSFEELHEEGGLMYNDTLSRYLQKLVDHIQSKNTFLEDRYYVFTGRNSTPNAYSYGEGIIVFNLGLLHQLKTEGEIAFVLAHEMAHDYLSHLWQRVKTRALLMNDDEFKKSVKKAVAKKYNNYHAVDSVLAIYASNIMQNSRENELEADSLGFVMLVNAGYKSEEAVSLLKKLDSIDYLNYKDSIDLKKEFDFTEYPFNKEWLEYLDETSWKVPENYNKIPDSLKTHPNCGLRMKIIEETDLYENNNTTAVGNIVNETNVPYKEMAVIHNLEILLSEENVSLGLFETINHLKASDENNIYLRGLVVEGLFMIWKAKKMYRFLKVVDKDNHLYPKSYNDFLHYLHNINATVYKNHALLYYMKHVSGKIKGEYGEYLDILTDSFDKDDKILKQKALVFKERFGDSYYYNRLIKNLNISINK